MIAQSTLRDQLANGEAPLLIDVRTPEEYERGTIADAINIPHTVIADKILVEVPDKSTPFILFCRSGHRTGMALDAVTALGYTHAEPLEDGYDRWIQHTA